MTQATDPSLPEWVECLEAHREILEAAGTIEEWNDVVSEILEFWITRERPGLLLNRERALLTEAVRRGFKPKPHRAPHKLTARSDANLILRAGCKTFIDAARHIAQPPHLVEEHRIPPDGREQEAG
jgi:hypothetical protein